MISYRTFRNADPPSVLDVWLASRDSRAFGVPTSCDALEALLFSKPYFDREGFILAEDDGHVVGFVHAGFGSDEAKQALDTTIGAVYMLRVAPDYRRKGIGTSLLKLALAYLDRRGAEEHYFGGMYPLNGFYQGLYGGSELPGILESDAGTRSFAVSRGFEPVDCCMVFHRRISEPPRSADARIHLLRRMVEVQAEPWPMPETWWDACVLGNIPSLRYEMTEKETRQTIGHAWVWEMECFSEAWQLPAVGIIDFQIADAFRRRGYGKLLLLTMLKHLREQNIELVELQTMATNEAARGLYEGLGFEHVDTGHAFRLANPMDLSNLPPVSSMPVRSPHRRRSS